MNSLLSHLDSSGEAHMVDVGPKVATQRLAVVRCEVCMKPETLELLHAEALKKGDAFTVAKTAGILAAKKTPDLIPLCHSLALDHIDIDFTDRKEGDGVLIEVQVKSFSKTGVEMEAFTAASIAALTIYDMAKAVDPAMVITNIHLVRKKGGKSGFEEEVGG